MSFNDASAREARLKRYTRRKQHLKPEALSSFALEALSGLQLNEMKN